MPTCFANPIWHGRDRLHTAPPPLRHNLSRPRGLNLRAYNISDGLAQAIWAVHLRNYNVMMLSETNISDGAYCHKRLRYSVVCSPASVTATWGAQRVVGLVVQEKMKGYSMESTRFHGLNMVNCEVVSGDHRNPLIGAYLQPGATPRPDGGPSTLPGPGPLSDGRP